MVADLVGDVEEEAEAEEGATAGAREEEEAYDFM